MKKLTSDIREEVINELQEINLALSITNKNDPKRRLVIEKKNELERTLRNMKERLTEHPDAKLAKLWRIAAATLPQNVVDKIKIAGDKKEKLVLHIMNDKEMEMCINFPEIKKELASIKTRVNEAKKRIQGMQIDVSSSDDPMWYKKSVEFNREINKVLRELNGIK